MMTKFGLGVCLAAAFAVSSLSADGAAIVTVGNHTLLANTPGQTITISISGAEQVAGEDLFAQIGDGGSINGGINTKPVFSNVDIIHGTIFDGNNTGAQGDPNGVPPGSNAGHPLIWLDSTVTNSGTVSDNGLLATLTVDTTGLNSGTFPLLLSGVANTLGTFNTTVRDAAGAPIALTIQNGTITVAAPEPSTVGLVCVFGLTALARRRRV